MAGINRIGFVDGSQCRSIRRLQQKHFAGRDGAPADGSQPAAQTDTASNPIAQAASEWLDAVLKGDTQRASARLTPQAMQQIIESGNGILPAGS